MSVGWSLCIFSWYAQNKKERKKDRKKGRKKERQNVLCSTEPPFSASIILPSHSVAGVPGPHLLNLCCPRSLSAHSSYLDPHSTASSMARKKATESVIQEADTRQTTPRLKTEDGDSSLFPTHIPPAPKAAPRKRKASSARRASTPKIVEPSSNVITDSIASVFSFFFRFIGDVFGTAISLIRKPLAVFFSLYILAVIIAYAYQFAQTSIYIALSPLCKIPGVSLLDAPFCDYNPSKTRNGRKRGGGDFPELINLQSNFGSILENSVGGSHMALDLKKSEVAVRDLSTLVRVSELLCRLTPRITLFLSIS